jgi:class 3 adenylate cyclase/predicted ATPase
VSIRCPNCQTLNPPNAKFCLECGNRLVVCPNCSTINLPIAKFCIECGTPLQAKTSQVRTGPASQSKTQTDDLDTYATEPIPSINANTEEKPLLSLPEERRIVTIMFADITGSTPLADRLDPEDMRAILTGYFNLMTQQIRKHGGTVEKYIGDAVMAVFGAPLAHEDDPDRALRAALDMQEALAKFNTERQQYDTNATHLQMRIGVNTGEVAAPSNSSPQRQDFLITGDAVNIAARLQQAAAPDTILVGERTYLPTRDIFQFKPMAPLALRGKAEPINAYVVLGLRLQSSIIPQHPRGLRGQTAPLVGRSLELTLLHASYARVLAERRPHLITILGTPGIGKSRLVREFIAREQETLKSSSSIGEKAPPKVLKGRCPPYGESITYWPLIEILRSLLHVQDHETSAELHNRFTTFVRDTFNHAGRPESADEIAGILLQRIGPSLSGQNVPIKQQSDNGRILPGMPMTRNETLKQGSVGTQGELLRAWRVFIEALGELNPLIIVIDDLQWADEPLLDLLEYLTDRVTSATILFLCPARPDLFERRRDWGGGHRNFTTIELESLSWEESSDLIAALLNNNDLPEALRYTILVRAEGNPFFVEEIIRMLIDQGILIRAIDKERNKEYWRIGNSDDELIEQLSTPGEPPEDALEESHYRLLLPHVPDTIQGVLAARVDLLDPTEKQMLQHASIVGRTFWLSSLLELTANMSVEAVLAALASLIRHDFVVELAKQSNTPVENDRTFSFKHILIRDVVYNNIPRQRRAREHTRLALWLETQIADKSGTFIEALANHYQQALDAWSTNSSVDVIQIDDQFGTDGHPFQLSRADLRERTIRYLSLAGDQALHNYYTLRALRAYSDAYDLLLDAQADPYKRSQMLEKLANVYVQRGNMDEAWQQYRTALRLFITRDTTQETSATSQDNENTYLLRLYEKLALISTRWETHFDTPADNQEIRNYIDTSLGLLQDKPFSREKVAFLTYRALWDIRQVSVVPLEDKADLAEQALKSGQEALILAEKLDNPQTLSIALDAMSFIYEQQRQYLQAREMLQRRQKLESLLTDRDELYDLYCSLGRIYERTAEYQTSLMWLGRAWNIAQTMESPAMMINSLVGRMRTWRQWNRWDDAEQAAREILQFVDKYHQREKYQFWALETLSTIAYHRGQQEEGEHYEKRLKRLLDRQAEHTSQEKPFDIVTSLHAIHHARENWKQAVADYELKLHNNGPFPSPELLATLAELLIMQDEQEQEEGRQQYQAEICNQAVNASEQSGARKSLAVAYRARGRMCMQQRAWEQAESDLHQSLHYCEILDLPWEKGHTLYYLGQFYQQRANDIYVEDSSKNDADISRASYNFEQARGFYESLRAVPRQHKVQQAMQNLVSTANVGVE